MITKRVLTNIVAFQMFVIASLGLGLYVVIDILHTREARELAATKRACQLDEPGTSSSGLEWRRLY